MRASRVFAAVLLLKALASVLGRPSEGNAQGGPRSGPLLDAATILNGCPSSRPHTNATLPELIGDWCGLANAGQEHVGPEESCRRFRASSDEGRMRLDIIILRAGHATRNHSTIFSQIENRSWISTVGAETKNFFVGFSEDRRTLNLCGTISSDGRIPEDVYSASVAPCPAPGEVRAADDPRPHVQHCYPQENTV